MVEHHNQGATRPSVEATVVNSKTTFSSERKDSIQRDLGAFPKPPFPLAPLTGGELVSLLGSEADRDGGEMQRRTLRASHGGDLR